MARRRVSGDSKLRRQLRRWPEELRRGVQTVMTYSGDTLRAEIERLAPKDEGDMAEQALSRVSRDGLSVQVGYSKRVGFKTAWKRGGFKALFQQWGTRHHPATPFIDVAYRNKLAGILGDIDAAVNKAINRASEL